MCTCFYSEPCENAKGSCEHVLKLHLVSDKDFLICSGAGAKNNEYKIITAALSEIAAITFFVSIITYFFFQLGRNHFHHPKI